MCEYITAIYALLVLSPFRSAPSCARFLIADLQSIPALSNNEVLNAVHHLLQFAADVLTMGNIELVVRGEYIRNLHWYHELDHMLAGAAVEE